MVRSLIMIALAVVCGAAAAIGVNQSVQSNKPKTDIVERKTILVAAQRIGRGEEATATNLKEVKWPVDLIPLGTIESKNDALGRVALAAILPGEPIFSGKLTDLSGKGFFASIIKPGMRAYTIQTRGPSSSVAGFVRPKDKVDILVNLRGTNNDQSGGGSTTTLLQSVEILAIDQILDPDVNTMQMLEMWAKGDNLASVTLEVTPEQASLLALGQAYGELSLALRNSGDEITVESIPATLSDIRELEYAALGIKTDGDDQEDSEADETTQAVPTSTKPAMTLKRDKEEPPPPPPPPPTYIHTLRGSQVGRVDLTLSKEMKATDKTLIE